MLTTEDPMDLTSDINRRQIVDDDIDIDLDLTGDQGLDREDDYMVEDYNLVTGQDALDSQVAQGGRDDEMLDGGYSLQDTEDDFTVHDEQLEDAIYLVLEDNAGFLPEISGAPEADQNAGLTRTTPQGRELDENHVGQSPSDCGSTPSVDKDVTKLGEKAELSPGSTPGVEIVQIGETLPQPDETRTARQLISNKTLTHTAKINQEIDSTWDNRPKDGPEYLFPSPHPEDTVLPPNGSDTPGDISSVVFIHPVTVIYQSSEMSLFPIADQAQEYSHTYLLNDETLAGESIITLFRACREVLAGSLEDDEELEIMIEELGLQISEVSHEY